MDNKKRYFFDAERWWALNMKIVFRCDGSTAMGLGHIFRCKTLASVLIEKGVQCIFVIRLHEPSSYYSRVMGEMQTVFLPSETTPLADSDQNPLAIIDTWLGVSQEKEIQDLTKIILDYEADLVVVDHYAYDLRMSELLSQHTVLAIIDDLCNRTLVCDYVINHNLGFNKEDYHNCKNRHGQRATILLGPEYCLIDKRFSELAKQKSICKNDRINLLISFGALDHNNLSFSVLDEIFDSDLSGSINVSVMLHANAPHRRQLERWSSNFDDLVKFYWSPQNVPKLYSEAHLAIGAGGTSAWERCAAGLPTLMLSAAANQKRIIHYISQAGGGKLISIDKTKQNYIISELKSILENTYCLKTMSENARKIVDGYGVDRVVREFFKHAS